MFPKNQVDVEYPDTAKYSGTRKDGRNLVEEWIEKMKDKVSFSHVLLPTVSSTHTRRSKGAFCSVFLHLCRTAIMSGTRRRSYRSIPATWITCWVRLAHAGVSHRSAVIIIIMVPLLCSNDGFCNSRSI